MKIVAAPNSFKGSLGAVEAAEVISRGFSAVFPERDIIQLPLADGGDGTVECILKAVGGRIFYKKVTGPLGKGLQASWGLTEDGSTAIIEVASATGITLLPEECRDPLRATSYGTGELIREALDSGCRKIFIGLGGSATNDGGAGILQALGVKLLDCRGRELEQGALPLEKLSFIDTSEIHPRLKEVELTAGWDVDNQLCGPQGAAFIYAPQKGASDIQLPLLDRCLSIFASVIVSQFGCKVEHIPGAGAAGGIGAGLAGVLKAKLVPGAEKIMEITGLPSLLQTGQVRLVVTGEGEINPQSMRGKVPVGVSRLAARYNVPVLVLAGKISLDPETARQAGITAMLSITNKPMHLSEAMKNTSALLESAAREAAYLFLAGGQTVSRHIP